MRKPSLREIYKNREGVTIHSFMARLYAMSILMGNLLLLTVPCDVHLKEENYGGLESLCDVPKVIRPVSWWQDWVSHSGLLPSSSAVSTTQKRLKPLPEAS